MAVPVSASDELRELHDDYVWQVNAAVGRNERQVVDRLSREYTDRALRMITGHGR